VTLIAGPVFNRAGDIAYGDAGFGSLVIFAFCLQGIFYTSGPNACSLGQDPSNDARLIVGVSPRSPVSVRGARNHWKGAGFLDLPLRLRRTCFWALISKGAGFYSLRDPLSIGSRPAGSSLRIGLPAPHVSAKTLDAARVLWHGGQNPCRRRLPKARFPRSRVVIVW
jgi:hypothetical protein